MRVRKIDADGDMVFGGDQSAFWKDVPDGPAQVVGTRLQMGQGEWYLDRRDGTPWKTQVLGKYTGSTRDMVIRARITGSPGVTQITAYSSSLDRETRKFTAAATIDTAYGQATISEPL
ncbi:hypothetical protein [Labrys neptuniae]